MKILPYVTIVMPIRNEARYIQRCLEGVLNQDYPTERMEIIIADGLSEDGTREIVQSIRAKQDSPSIMLVDNLGRIVPNGLNAAIRRAKGDIIVRVDGHCQIPPGYVRRCVEHLQKDGVDGVGGSIDTIGETWAARAIAVGMSSPFGVGGSAFRTTVGRTKLVDTVPFPAYWREVIERAGLYDEELVRNQDDEYNYRLREMGAKILLAADIRSRYYSRSTLRSLWRQYYQYGFWKVRVLQKHPLQMRPRQFAPPVFVAALLGSGVLAVITPAGRYLLALMVGSYALANLGASIWRAARKGWGYLPLLPLVYTILHLSYGLGFLVGLVRFAGRWTDK